jgi:transmembrane sensor
MSRAQQANDRAADFIERRELASWSAQDQAELDAWLAAAFGHRAAYWRLDHSWREADRIGALGPIPAPTPASSRPEPTASRDRRQRRGMWALAASMVLAVGLGSVATLKGRGPLFGRAADTLATSHYATPVGARRTITLDDGSRIELNTATAARTAITSANREVWLDHGEAYFEVAHLGGRPFVVHAGTRTITVIGTKFAVRRDGDRVTVSVVEGRVRVSDVKLGTESSAVISAGDMAVAQGAATLLTQKSEARVQDALSWRSGLLSFEQSPLPAVAAEFNRYNPKHIVVEGEDASARRIGGAFPASDPEGFVRLLASAYGLHVEEKPDEIIISD